MLSGTPQANSADKEVKTNDFIEADVNAYAAREAKRALGKLLVTKAWDGDLDYVRYLLRLGPDKIDLNAITSRTVGPGSFLVEHPENVLNDYDEDEDECDMGALDAALFQNHSEVALEL
eukprot:928508_1